MINFYHRFIPNAATILRPLYHALRGKTQKELIIWSQSMHNSFTRDNATMLAHPTPSMLIAITCDASDIGLGATLEQYVSGSWQPLAFYSRQLRAAELNTGHLFGSCQYVISDISSKDELSLYSQTISL